MCSRCRTKGSHSPAPAASAPAQARGQCLAPQPPPGSRPWGAGAPGSRTRHPGPRLPGSAPPRRGGHAGSSHTLSVLSWPGAAASWRGGQQHLAHAWDTRPTPGTPGPQGSVSCPGSCHRPGDEAHPPLTSRRLHPMGQLCTLFTSHWHTGITSPPYPLNTRSETHSENHCVWRGSQLLVLMRFLWLSLKKHRVFWFSYVRSAQESAISRASPQG